MGAAQALYALQVTDNALATQHRRLAEVDAQLGESDELRQAREAHRTAQEAAHQTQTHLGTLELEVNGLTDRSDKANQHLYSGTVRNPKELQSMAADLQQWQRMRAGLEDQVLEAMMTLDKERAVLSWHAEALAQVEASWQQAQASLRVERAQLQESLSNLEEKRRQQTAVIPATDLAAYERLRQRLGRAVALLQSNVCGGCGLTLPTGQVQQARMNPNLTFCPNCQRVLAVSG